jgi:hypothetical protein
MLRSVVVVALSLALAGLAQADRGRRVIPKKLGAGMMSKAYLSRDGRFVIKKVRPRLGGVKPLTRADRQRLANQSVTLMAVLRRGGLPIPDAVVPEGHPGMIVQEFAGEGVGFGELPWRARPRAFGSALASYSRAVFLATRAGYRPVLIDPKIGNFRFGPSGRVVSWFDPVGIGGPIDWIKLRSRMLRDRLAE